MKDKCTLSNEELIQRCQEWVSSLAETGGNSWVLQVPVNFDRDPDVLFCELIDRFKNCITEPPPSMKPQSMMCRQLWKESKRLYPKPEDGAGYREVYSLRNVRQWLREAHISCAQKYAGRIKELEKGVEILKELCQLKNYKDTVGKDSFYEKRQPELWKEANEFLNSLVNRIS